MLSLDRRRIIQMTILNFLSRLPERLKVEAVMFEKIFYHQWRQPLWEQIWYVTYVSLPVMGHSWLLLSRQQSSINNRACHPGSQYWNCYPDTPSLNKANATHLKIGHPSMKSTGAWFSNELQKLGSMRGYHDCSLRNGHQVTYPFWCIYITWICNLYQFKYFSYKVSEHSNTLLVPLCLQGLFCVCAQPMRDSITM